MSGYQDKVISISSIWLFWFPGPQTSNCSLGTPACPSKPWRIFVANIPSTVCNYFNFKRWLPPLALIKGNDASWTLWVRSESFPSVPSAQMQLRRFGSVIITVSHNLSKLHAVSIMQCDFCENTKDAKGLWHAAGDRPTQNLWRITATGRHLQFVSFMDTVTVLGTPLPDNTMSRRSFSKVSWRTSSFKKSLEKSPLWRCLALRKYPNHWLEEQFFKL